MKQVYLLATLDTKGPEAAFVRDELAALGVSVRVVDTGCSGAGGDRGRAVTAAAEGAARLVEEAHRKGELAGVIALGGSAGTTIGTAAMKRLPIGVPKVMASTLASGQVRQFVGDKDIFMLNTVTDIAGLNRITVPILAQAARAMAGMVQAASRPLPRGEKPLVAATMFGVTTSCVQQARTVLEAAGYEVVVFHATGNGGQAMESLLREGAFEAVLDLTTTELADEHVGGFLTAGPDRLTAAGEKGIPQLVSVGALDMVNFHAPETVPAKFKDRKFHKHNANVTLMRTTSEENARIGADIGRKVAAAKGPVSVLLPKRGLSAIDREGQSFNDPEARRALYDAIRGAAGKVEVVELDFHINDKEFAEAAARKLLDLMKSKPRIPG